MSMFIGKIEETNNGGHAGFLLNCRLDNVAKEGDKFTITLMGQTHELEIEPENIAMPGWVWIFEADMGSKRQVITIEATE